MKSSPFKSIEEAHEATQRFFSDKEFNDELELHVKIIQDLFKEKELKGYPSRVIVVGREKTTLKQDIRILNINATEKEYRDNKFNIFYNLGKKFSIDDEDFLPMAVFLQSEAWVKQMSKEEGEKWKKEGEKPVRELEGKQEVLIIAGLTIDQRNNMAVLQVNRTSNGKIILGLKPVYTFYDMKKKNEGANNFLLQEFFKGYARGFFERDEIKAKN